MVIQGGQLLDAKAGVSSCNHMVNYNYIVAVVTINNCKAYKPIFVKVTKTAAELATKHLQFMSYSMI